MPRGRPDPFSQVADGGRVHLVPDLEILEQQRSQLDEPQCRLAPCDDGVHAGAIAVMRTDTAIAIAVQGCGIAAGATVALACDQIDERGVLGLLHGLPHYGAGHWRLGWELDPPWVLGRPVAAGLAQYMRPISQRQEGNPAQAGYRRESGRLAEDEVDREGAEFVHDGVDPGDDVAIDRTRRGG